jgi:16S rRNA (guanine527-N7)-methyltransferase
VKHRPEIVTAITQLCDRYRIGSQCSDKLESLLELVVQDPAAPTTVRDPLGVMHDHLADSVVALDLECVRRARLIADLGSGAGFPGLPLAVALPGSSVALVESNGRKCDFLSRAVAGCRADNAVVVRDRAETWLDGRGRCDLVVARALAPLPVVAEYAAPLLIVDGALVVWRGRRDEADEAAARRAAEELGLDYREPMPVQPFPGALHRHLQMLVKVSETPPRFPRRPGVARKRPLGSPGDGASGSPSDRAQR